MAREGQKSQIKRWQRRINDAVKAKQKWAKAYMVEKGKRYYKGFQRSQDDMVDAKQNPKVQVNLIGPTIATRLPNQYYYHPYAKVVGSPAISDTPGQEIEDKAQLLQDTANTIIRDPATGFKRETLMALKEAQWMFGVIETGYSADFIDNPLFKRPALVENEQDAEEITAQPDAKPPDGVQPRGMDPQDIESLELLISDEQFFVKRIPPETFYISISGNPWLEANDWCGYYEWMYVEDVRESPAFKNTEKLKATGYISSDYTSASNPEPPKGIGDDPEPTGDQDREGQCKVWRIWDMRQKTKYTFAEGKGNDKFLRVEKYRHLPIHILTFDDQSDDCYPTPPVFAMIGMQDEYNDTREMMRVFRGVVIPRYLAEMSLDPSERSKLENGPPGVIAYVQSLSGGMPVQPVAQPQMDAGLIRALSVTKSDFNETSRSSGEARGNADSDTATQAQIINQRDMVKETWDRQRVAEWLGSIIRSLLLLAIDRMSLPMWVLRNADPQATGFMVEAQKISQMYREITYSDLEEVDRVLRWDVNVDVESLSPMTEDTRRAQWQQVIATLSNPAIAMLLSKSPELTELTLTYFGIRSMRDRQAIFQALGIVSQQAMMGAAPGNPNPQPAPGNPGPTPAPPQLSPGLPTAEQTPPPGSPNAGVPSSVQAVGPPHPMPGPVGPPVGGR